MANAHPILIATCTCGRILLRDDGLFWDGSKSIKGLAEDKRLKEEKCPCCGGDKKIPLGDYYLSATA